MDTGKVFTKVKSEIKDFIITDEVFWENEIEANIPWLKY